MVERRPKVIRLVSHTAVDYVYAQGVGIGLVQRAECATTGIIKNDIIQTEERKYSIKRENFAVENIKTPERALMLALLHALGLACGTIKRRPKTVQLQEVTILSSSPTIVQIINHHIKHAPKSLEDVASTNDRSMIKRVVAGVRRLSHHGLEVSISIAVFDREDETGETARTMARQRGRKACRSRRQLRLTQNDTSTERSIVGDEAALEGTLELPVLIRTPSEGTKHEETAKQRKSIQR